MSRIGKMPITLPQGVTATVEGQTIIARQVIIDWNPWGLMQDNIDFSKLQVASLDIALTENAVADEQPFSLPQISLPLGLRINNAEINAISITTCTRSACNDLMQ